MPIAEFDPALWVPEPKLIRMMSRDAQLAVAAATLALRDSGITIGTTYAAHDVGLFGATGLAGIALDEVARLVKASAGPAGELDIQKFGAVALRQVRPVLSFKILANMPLCFVSIILNLQGANAIFNPWEQQGAQAILAGADAIRRGRAVAALVGGTDVKTHELGLLALKHQGVFTGRPIIVGEGAAFLLLEDEQAARRRNARIYARLAPHGASGADGIVQATESSGPKAFWPKETIGDLFAAAAAVQVAMAGVWCSRGCLRVLAKCAGHGGKPMDFILEAA